MANHWFQFKQFKIIQEKSAMKVGVDSVLFGACISFASPKSVLDIGTGTGLLAFMALQRTGANITGVEIDLPSYEECLQNILLNKKKSEIEVIHSTFQDFTVTAGRTFDHIISNPPWFNNSYSSPDNNRNTARQNASLPINELCEGVGLLLSAKGVFSVIIPYENEAVFIAEAEKIGLKCFRRVWVRPHLEKAFHRSILEFSFNEKESTHLEVCIRNYQTRRYSDEYKALTKAFYL
jgi:tRNA1Val (adenine37-N6)-methyltransferase